MKKTIFSLFPLVVLLFAPAVHRSFFSSSTLSALDVETASAASWTEHASVVEVRKRLGEAERLLKSRAHNELAGDEVVVAAEDLRSAKIHLLTLKKESFLNGESAEDVTVVSSLGEPLRFRVVRSNYVNTAVRLTDAGGHELSPLMVRYPIERGGKVEEVGYYTSVHPALRSPELVLAGRDYVRRTLHGAATRLAAKGQKIAPEIVGVAEHLTIVEHADHKRFEKEDKSALFDEIFTLYALNVGDTYRYSVSTAGAGGMIQMSPSTYEMTRKRHPEAELTPDFVEGMRDHVNASEAMLLYMQDTWNDLMRQDEIRSALDTRLATQTELLAAGYNSNPARLARYIERGGTLWRTLIPRETQMYLRIYAAVERHGLLETDS